MGVVEGQGRGGRVADREEATRRKGVKEGRKHGALRPQKPSSLIRDGEAGRSGILYLTPTRYTVTTRMILH